MQNVNMVVKGNKLLIELDHTQELYATEKSKIVATTGGSIEVPNVPGVKVGLNVFKPNKNTAAVVRDTKNIKFTVKANKLTLEIDLTQDFGQSSTGKSIIVASSGGNTAIMDLPHLRIGVNVYKPVPKGTPIQQTLV